MTINYDRAKSLCTDAEMRLVNDSRREHLKSWSKAQLKTKIGRARKLRNKWQDQARTQRRTTQRKLGRRAAAGNARSRSKAKLFGNVLERFERQLTRTQKAEDDRTKAPPAKRAKRVATQRKSRLRSAAKKSTTKIKQRPKPPSQVDGLLDVKRPNKKTQRRAITKAKTARVAKSGLTSRIRGHVSARERRAQGKRDSR